MASTSKTPKPKPKWTSKWWEPYEPSETPGKAKCKLCKYEISTGGGTTNAKNHLNFKHFDKFFEIDNKSTSTAAKRRKINESGTESEEEWEDVDDPLSAEGEEGANDSGSSSSRGTTPTPGGGPRASPTPTQSRQTPSPGPMSPPPPPESPGGTKRSTQQSILAFGNLASKTVERLNMAVAFFIVTCCLPLSLVEKAGFIILCGILRPNFKPVGRKALTKTYVPKLYNATKRKLEAMLLQSSWIACTSDTWTSRADESYIALTAHFITDSWELIAFTLCCRQFLDYHNGLNYKSWFLEAFKEWGINISKVTSFTIDNGDNIRLAVDLLRGYGVACMRCFGHTIQTGCTLIETMVAVRSLRKAAQSMLTFMSGTKVWKKYEEYMKLHHSDVEARKLPRPVATRWWSHMPLFQVLADDEEYHRGFLAWYENGKHLHLRLSDAHLRTLKTLLLTLGPLEELCTALAGDKYVTASAVLPCLYLLENLQENVSAARTADNRGSGDGPAPADGDIEMASWDEEEDNNASPPDVDPSMLKIVINRLHKRYYPAGVQASQDRGVDLDLEDDVEVAQRVNAEAVRKCDVDGRKHAYELLVKCSYVDGRYRCDLKPEDITCAREQLLDELTAEAVAEGFAQSTSEAENAQSKKKTGLTALFEKFAAPRARAGSASNSNSSDAGAPSSSQYIRERIKKEMANFETLTVDRDANVLLWWKVHETTFPLLSKAARKYLAVPATSTESERLFSYAGLVINALRTCLTGTHAEWLIFLGMNKDFVPKP